MQQPFLTGKQPILTGVLFLFLIPITKLYSSIWTQSIVGDHDELFGYGVERT